MLLCVGAHKNTLERRIFFGSSVDESHYLLHKNKIEVNLKGEIKFQMMMMGRSGHGKD